MTNTVQSTQSAAQTAPQPTVPEERTKFLHKLLINPNYFGNIDGSAFKAVQPIKSNTTYEELKCVGFNPELSQLEGVVWIKQSGGYDGDICSSGSQEYVSFFLSYDNGATWLPQGTVHFSVYDVTGPHPLEYAVRLPIQPKKEICFVANLPLVRAILSWNVAPSGPNAVPVWGNVIQTRIQIPGYFLEIPLPILLEEAKIKLPADVASIIAPDAAIKLSAPKSLSTSELLTLYASSNVPTHRSLNKQIHSALKNSAALAISSKYLSGLNVDVSAVVAALAATNGNTDFEQLECIGLEEGDGNPDALIGTLQIKLPTGYLGGPCFAGSREYVAFWIDWGGGWQYVGTASTNVHDIASIPKEGLSYAVYLPVDLNAHRKPCQDGPVTASVRAILSWDSPPPPANPNFVPVWGNRLETNILVNPGESQPTGNFTPYFTSICGVDPCHIDQSSGWAYPGAGDQPFGASIAIYGVMPGQPLFVDPPAGLPVYQVTVEKFNTATMTWGAPQILTDPFPISILKQVGGGFPTAASQTQFATGGFYTWQQMTPSAAGWNSVSLEGVGGGQGPLTVWNSVGEGLYRISVTAWNAAKTVSFAAGAFICDGTTFQSVVIDLDQTPPVPDLQITGYKPGGVGPCISAVDCQTFTVGDVICGTYSVSDAHIGGFSLQAEPTPSPTSGFTVDGAAVNGESYPAIPVTVTSKSGEWTYDTKGLPPCGYTIELFTNDRTIVSCDGSWENNSKFVGFCLVAKS